MCEKLVLTGLLPEEIAETFGFAQAFRAVQIFKWIASGVETFAAMTNIGKSARAMLEERSLIRTSSVSQILKDPDGTIKLQIALHDGLAIETVLLTDRDGRKTACVSCQAGCPMGCAFCMTGKLGLARNLSAAEIVEEFLFLEKEAGQLDNIVFMGMGEPLLNLPAIRKAVAVLTHKDGRKLSGRRITLSTSGIVGGIYELADRGPQVRLALSLTTAHDGLRTRLMPVNKTNPLPELKKAVAYYSERTGKRVTLEAALLSGVNTDAASAADMIAFARGLAVNINLIPWNPVADLPFKEPSAEEAKQFMRMLTGAGLNVTLRARRGRKINGACGQLGKTHCSNAAAANTAIT